MSERLPLGWTETALGNIVLVNPESVSRINNGRIRYVDLSAVSAEKGIELSAVRDYDLSAAPGRAQRVIRTADVLVATVRPYLRGFAVVPSELDGEVASTGFCVLRARPDVALPGYIWALATRDEFVDGLMTRATGSNYPAVRPQDVAEQIVPLPTLSEQRRIVDLMASVDESAAAVAREISALEAALAAMREHQLAAAPGTASVGDLIDAIQPGRSPEGEDRMPRPGESSVLKVSAVRPGWFDATQVKVIRSVRGFPEYAKVQSGDLLITRANTRELVGAVCVVEAAPENTYLCDKTLRLVPRRARASTAYLFEVLQSAGARLQLSDAASGTSGSMKNISQESIRAVRIPVMETMDQERLVHVLDPIRAARSCALSCAMQLRVVTRRLTADLISGRRTLPESYDRILDGAA